MYDMKDLDLIQPFGKGLCGNVGLHCDLYVAESGKWLAASSNEIHS